MAKKEIVVVGAVIMREGLVMCAQRGSAKTLPDLWEFPGGKIEAGETAQEALQREIREELHLRIDVGERITTTRYEYDFGIVDLTTFYCVLLDGEPRLTEHAAIRWVPPHELDSLQWAPADVPAVEFIMEAHAT